MDAGAVTDVVLEQALTAGREYREEDGPLAGR